MQSIQNLITAKTFELSDKKYTFDDWLNGELEKYREAARLPPGTMPHIHLHSYKKGASMKARTYQEDAFHMLSDIVVYLRVERLFKVESRRASSKSEAIQAEIDFLKESLNELDKEVVLAVKKGQTDFNGFGPKQCRQIMDMAQRFEDEALTEDDTRTVSKLESIAQINKRFRGAILNKQIKRLVLNRQIANSSTLKKSITKEDVVSKWHSYLDKDYKRYSALVKVRKWLDKNGINPDKNHFPFAIPNEDDPDNSFYRYANKHRDWSHDRNN